MMDTVTIEISVTPGAGHTFAGAAWEHSVAIPFTRTCRLRTGRTTTTAPSELGIEVDIDEQQQMDWLNDLDRADGFRSMWMRDMGVRYCVGRCLVR